MKAIVKVKFLRKMIAIKHYIAFRVFTTQKQNTLTLLSEYDARTIILRKINNKCGAIATNLDLSFPEKTNT